MNLQKQSNFIVDLTTEDKINEQLNNILQEEDTKEQQRVLKLSFNNKRDYVLSYYLMAYSMVLVKAPNIYQIYTNDYTNNNYTTNNKQKSTYELELEYLVESYDKLNSLLQGVTTMVGAVGILKDNNYIFQYIDDCDVVDVYMDYGVVFTIIQEEERVFLDNSNIEYIDSNLNLSSMSLEDYKSEIKRLKEM